MASHEPSDTVSDWPAWCDLQGEPAPAARVTPRQPHLRALIGAAKERRVGPRLAPGGLVARSVQVVEVDTTAVARGPQAVRSSSPSAGGHALQDPEVLHVPVLDGGEHCRGAGWAMRGQRGPISPGRFIPISDDGRDVRRLQPEAG